MQAGCEAAINPKEKGSADPKVAFRQERADRRPMIAVQARGWANGAGGWSMGWIVCCRVRIGCSGFCLD